MTSEPSASQSAHRLLATCGMKERLKRPGAPDKAQPPSQDPQGGRPGKKPDHSGGAGAQSGTTGHQGKRSSK